LTPAVSRDGQWLAYHGGEAQDKVYVARTDGQETRRVTDDGFVNRVARWSPDGQWLAFMSNRSGVMHIWAIHPDGSGLTQVTATGEDRYPVWSPDGKRMAYNRGPRGSFLIEFGRRTQQTPIRVPVEIEPGGWFGVSDWSRAGDLLLGHMRRADGTSKGIGVYSLGAGTFEQVSEFGFLPRWLNDDRRVLFWNDQKLYVADRRSRAPREVFAAPELDQNFDIAPDNRRIYFSLMAGEADVWLMTSRDDSSR
jgi:dipeptidyl aminopeptidase/acylaminoacyl peptidase